MSFLVRRAQVEEYAAAGEVAASGYDADDLLTLPDGTLDDYYRARLLDAETRAREAELIVAVGQAGTDRESLVGTVTWCPLSSPWRQLAQHDHQGEFRMLAVAPAGRRRGVGRALVAACLDRARQAGMTEMVVSSLPRMTAAHQIYRSYGFVRAPELDFTPMAQVDLWGFRLALD